MPPPWPARAPARRARSRPAAAGRRGAGSATSSPARCVALRPVWSRYQLAQPVLQTVPVHAPVDVRVVALLRLGPDLDRLGAAAAHVPQRRHHVGDLGLDHVDHRAVPEPGVRAEQEEQVREAGDGRAEVRARAAVPDVVEQHAAAAAHALGGRDVGDVEAGAEDDRVDRPLDAVGADDRAFARTSRTPLGDELDVRLAERAVPAVGRQDPLAADRVVGRDLLEQRAGRRSALRMCRRAIRSTKRISRGFLTKPSTSTSRPA